MKKQFRRFVGPLLCAASAAALMPSSAYAMEFHVQGNRIYASGAFVLGDEQRLQLLLDAAEAQGVAIDEIVFRTSPGGAALAGTAIGQLVRQRGLNTVFQGGCYSACSAAFVGGVERRIADNDLPDFLPTFAPNIMGIHGSSVNNVPSQNQSDILAHYNSLLENEIPEEAIIRIRGAITGLIDGQGFLRYFDPETSDMITRFCATGDTSDDATCTDYPGVTIVSDGLVNQDDRADLTANTLMVTGDVEGNINPGHRQTNFDTSLADVNLDDAFGVIRVEGNGVWRQTASTGADLISVQDGGLIILEPGSDDVAELSNEIYRFNFRNLATFDWGFFFDDRPTATFVYVGQDGEVRLNGGALKSDLGTVVRRGGRVTGSGSILSDTIFGSTAVFNPTDIQIRPYEFQTSGGGNPARVSKGDAAVILGSGAIAQFDVSATDTSAKLSLVEANTYNKKLGLIFVLGQEFYVPEKHRGFLSIAETAELLLNVDQGFFAANQAIPLVQTIIDDSPADPSDTLLAVVATEELQTALNIPGVDSDQAFIEGQFNIGVNADGTRYSLEDGEVIHARNNSLLTFSIVQTDNSITAIANPAFDNTGLFGNRQSGDGLGVALRSASLDSSTPLLPLLGALQFTDVNVIRDQAGTLRGDSFATNGIFNRAVVDHFASSIQNEISSQRRLARASSGEDDGLSRASKTDTDKTALSSLGDEPGDTRFWLTGFGRFGDVSYERPIAGLTYESLGTVFGVEQRLSDSFVLGGTVGYGSGDTDSDDNTIFHNDARIWNFGLYGEYSYSGGYLSLAGQYSDIRNRTERTLTGIAGFETANTAEYNVDGWSFSLENGINLPNDGPTFTALLPLVNYTRLNSFDFAENGNTARLTGQDNGIESFRAGLGLEISDVWETSKGSVFAPYARFSVQREFADRNVNLSNAFAVEPTLRFRTTSQEIGRDVIELKAGISSSTDQNLTIRLDLNGQYTRNQKEAGIELGLTYRF